MLWSPIYVTVHGSVDWFGVVRDRKMLVSKKLAHPTNACAELYSWIFLGIARVFNGFIECWGVLALKMRCLEKRSWAIRGRWPNKDIQVEGCTNGALAPGWFTRARGPLIFASLDTRAMP